MNEKERRVLNQWLKKYPFLWAIRSMHWSDVRIHADRIGNFGIIQLLSGTTLGGGKVWAYIEGPVTGPHLVQINTAGHDPYERVKTTAISLLSRSQVLRFVVFEESMALCICKEPPGGWKSFLESYLSRMDDDKRTVPA
jgi:hypothetical protein